MEFVFSFDLTCSSFVFKSIHEAGYFLLFEGIPKIIPKPEPRIKSIQSQQGSSPPMTQSLVEATNTYHPF